MSEGDLVQDSINLEPRGNICRDPIDEIRAYNNICYMPPKFHCPLFVHVCVYVCVCVTESNLGGERCRRGGERERLRVERDGFSDGQKNYEREGGKRGKKPNVKKEKTREERT